MMKLAKTTPGSKESIGGDLKDVSVRVVRASMGIASGTVEENVLA